MFVGDSDIVRCDVDRWFPGGVVKGREKRSCVRFDICSIGEPFRIDGSPLYREAVT